MWFSPLGGPKNVFNGNPVDDQNGLVGWWTFDDVGYVDQSGNQNNGTAAGTPQPVGGLIRGNALKFNGTTDYVDVGTATSLRTSQFTYMAWIYATAVSGAGGAAIIGSTANSGPEWRIDNSTLLLDLIRQGVSVVGRSTNPISLNTLTHVAVSYNSSLGTPAGEWKHYINGVLDNTGTTSIPWTFSNFRIGQASVLDWFTGTIDDVRIYNWVMPAAEINAIYRRGLIQISEYEWPALGGNPVMNFDRTMLRSIYPNNRILAPDVWQNIRPLTAIAGGSPFFNFDMTDPRANLARMRGFMADVGETGAFPPIVVQELHSLPFLATMGRMTHR